MESVILTGQLIRPTPVKFAIRPSALLPGRIKRRARFAPTLITARATAGTLGKLVMPVAAAIKIILTPPAITPIAKLTATALIRRELIILVPAALAPPTTTWLVPRATAVTARFALPYV